MIADHDGLEADLYLDPLTITSIREGWASQISPKRTDSEDVDDGKPAERVHGPYKLCALIATSDQQLFPVNEAVSVVALIRDRALGHEVVGPEGVA